jgi:hypothetical protein
MKCLLMVLPRVFLKSLLSSIANNFKDGDNHS